MISQNARNPRGRQRAAVSALALALSLGSFTTGALAQDAEDDGDGAKPDIVVTGTLIRGVAAGGTNVVSLSQKDVQATGASTTAQLLQTIPQLGSFGGLQFPAGGTVTVNRPNLRSLPGFNTGGGSTTLVLLDGHRVVGMGTASTTPDPDFIPPGALQRVDVVPDGGSAIYGSDAVAGVLNFVTRRDFDGVEANARYGFGDSYHSFDANATIGRKWDGGSIFLSYAYARHDALFGRDRDFVQQFPSSTGLPAGNPQTGLARTCDPGNVIVGTGGSQIIYALPFTTATAGAAQFKANTCDQSDNASLYPREQRHSVMAGLNQQLSDSLSVDVRAYYFNRKSTNYTGPFTSTKSATAATRGFSTHQVGAETTQSVVFAYGNPDANRQEMGLSSWGVTTEFTYRPGGDWRVRLMGNYGESTTDSHSKTVYDTGLTNAINNGLFNPYDWRASDPAALAGLFNYESLAFAKQRLINFRAVADGSLFALPGGNVKLAVGAEYIREGFDTYSGTGIPGTIASGSSGTTVSGVLLAPAVAAATRYNLARNVKALFGELSVPIFGADNATTLFQALTLSLSGRYDHYSGGIGGTFNPKIGVNWTPFEGVRLRGAWGKAFNAPSLADTQEAAATTVGTIGQLGTLPAFLSFYKPPAGLIPGTFPAYTSDQTLLTIGGNSPGIKPQSGTTLSVGGDFEPSFVPGLRLGITYWRIRLKDAIGGAPFFDANQWWNFYRSKITILNGLTTAQKDALIAAAIANQTTPTPVTLCTPPTTLTGSDCVYAISDNRKLNKGNVNVSGLDFSVSYQSETGFGSIDASWKGTYQLEFEESAGPGAPLTNSLLTNNNQLRWTTTVGANIGNLRAQVTWNYRQGYNISPVVAIPGGGGAVQTHVGDFNVFNLFFKYDVPGEKLFKDLSFTLNIDNVFDQDPPIDYGSKALVAGSGYGNGSTLGRIFQIGVSKRF